MVEEKDHPHGMIRYLMLCKDRTPPAASRIGAYAALKRAAVASWPVPGCDSGALPDRPGERSPHGPNSYGPAASAEAAETSAALNVRVCWASFSTGSPSA
jgi:hypothetical protein